MTTEQPSGRRERKKRETRDALSAAALRLALEHGVQNVRVEEIADSAGVAPRTYNNYFASREQAIVAAIAAERTLRVSAALRERPADEPLSVAVAEAVVAQYTGPQPDERILALLTGNPTVRDEYLDAVAGFGAPLTAAIAARHPGCGELGAAVLAAAVAAATRVATERWLSSVPTKAAGGLVVVSGRSLADLLRESLGWVAPALDGAAHRRAPSGG